MLLVKKCPFFHYFVWLKIRLEIRLNNVLDTKGPFSDYKRKISESPKNCIFPKGLTYAFGQKMPNFLNLDLVKFQFFLNFFAFKTGLEIMFINVLDRKESCFCVKKFNISKSQKSLLCIQVNACFLVKKCQCSG